MSCPSPTGGWDGKEGKGKEGLALWRCLAHALHCTADLDNGFKPKTEPTWPIVQASASGLYLHPTVGSQSFTWDKLCPLLSPVQHKGSTHPASLSCLFHLRTPYSFHLLLVCLCHKPCTAPQSGIFLWSGAGTRQKRYHSPCDRTSFVISKFPSAYLLFFSPSADWEVNKDSISSILCLFEIAKSRNTPGRHVENFLYDTGPTLSKVLWIFNSNRHLKCAEASTGNFFLCYSSSLFICRSQMSIPFIAQPIFLVRSHNQNNSLIWELHWCFNSLIKGSPVSHL